MATMTHSSHRGRHVSRNGIALEPKKGIIRCDTTAKTIATNPHRPTCVVLRNSKSESMANDAEASHSVMTPTPLAKATARACTRSATLLMRSMVKNFKLSIVQPVATTATPAQASRVLV